MLRVRVAYVYRMLRLEVVGLAGIVGGEKTNLTLVGEFARGHRAAAQSAVGRDGGNHRDIDVAHQLLKFFKGFRVARGSRGLVLHARKIMPLGSLRYGNGSEFADRNSSKT